MEQFCILKKRKNGPEICRTAAVLRRLNNQAPLKAQKETKYVDMGRGNETDKKYRDKKN